MSLDLDALFQQGITASAQAVRAGELDPRELAAALLARIEDREQQVSAYISVNEQLPSQAGQAHQGPLAGLPAAIKDNLSTRELPTTCGSKILTGYRPPYEATVVERLRQAGALVAGKTNMDEFAMGSSTENSAFFPTRNPWDLERVPGGSSGGSAASVAAGEAFYALGSDTGGSIRQPASFCGVVGLKPTYGWVSRFGLVAFGSSLDQIGPLTRSTSDAAHVMQAIYGFDERDNTSVQQQLPDFTSFIGQEISGLRIGIPEEYFGEGVDDAVADTVRQAIERLETLGAQVDTCSLPHTRYALAAYYLIAPAEASSNLARYDGVRYGFRGQAAGGYESMFRQTRGEGFGPEVKRRIMLGTYALSAGYYDEYYLKALRVRRLVQEDFAAAFERFDLLVSPTSPTVAFKLGERQDDPLAMYQSDVCTIPVNLAGLPAISVPCGLVDNLPVGLQFIAPAFQDGELLRAAYAIEQELDLDLRPPLDGTASQNAQGVEAQ